jgi:hypothetical protein
MGSPDRPIAFRTDSNRHVVDAHPNCGRLGAPRTTSLTAKRAVRRSRRSCSRRPKSFGRLPTLLGRISKWTSSDPQNMAMPVPFVNIVTTINDLSVLSIWKIRVAEMAQLLGKQSHQIARVATGMLESHGRYGALGKLLLDRANFNVVCLSAYR